MLWVIWFPCFNYIFISVDLCNSCNSITYARGLHCLFSQTPTCTQPYWGLNKMHTILETLFQMHFLVNENVLSFDIRIPMNFVPDGPIDNKSALIQVMAVRETVKKPLVELMTTQVIGLCKCVIRSLWYVINLSYTFLICLFKWKLWHIVSYFFLWLWSCGFNFLFSLLLFVVVSDKGTFCQ